MKQKKPKSGPARTKPGRKAKGLCNVSPSTSLPPLVEGQLRCFLKLTVSKILWMVTKPPASVVVRVRWWGETSDGTVFIPRGTSQAEQKTFKTTTCYPVRCGPKQFISYLTDMGVLVLEVMTRTGHLPIGRVQIGGLSQLSPSHPISGFFTIVSPTSEKTGELQVSLALEPLSETYDSNSSVPNTDVSFSSHLPAPGTKEATDSSHFLAPSQLNRPPGGSIVGRESISSSRAPTPRGKDHLYFSENAEPLSEGFAPGQKDPSTVTAYKQTGLFPSGSDHEAQVRRGVGNPNLVHVLSLHNPVSKDLLSALLDRGNKLRNAMVASAMKSSPDSDIELYGAHPSIKPEDPRASGKNLKNLNSVLLPAGEDPLQPLPDISGFDLHTENRAIELLLGRSDIPPVSLLDGSPPDSVSLGSEAYGSELNDPHYDQSLLENLFYTARKSDSSLSDFLSDEENPASCEKHSKIQKSRNVSESGSVGQKGKAAETNVSSPARPLHEPHVEPAGEAAHAVNLSLDRLATLGRIHVARVVVESLKVPPEAGTQNTPGKKSSVGKPPKPASAQKRTFFVEYHFPVKATKNGIGQVAVTTEIIRVASSKISNEVVKFQQRYMFPVQFSGTAITHWWNSDLAFNIYLKKGTQRKPSPIGSAAFPLRDVIQSEQLAVSRELPVEEDNGVAQLGPLKVSLELATDSKDFSTTGTVPAKAGSQAPVFSVRSPAGKLQEVPGAVTPAKSPPLPKQTRCQLHTKIQEALPSASEKLRVGADQPPGPTPVSRNLLAQVSVAEEEGLLLHVLLMVPEGKDLAPADAGLHGSCNVYLNCKLFSTEEATRSAVVWGTRHPAFHFSQVTPISLIPKHLERLKNNVMVLEAWNKRPGPGGDQLLGLVKLPLHQFYVSFKDPKISTLLLRAQYPVVAVDGSLPVVDVFTGNKNGSLRVLLAMGSADQIVALQRLKNEEGALPPSMQRSAHALDLPAMPFPKLSTRGEDLMEHVFEVHIGCVKGLTPLQSTVWGEADCYVQYHFPVQESETSVLCGSEVCERGLRLKPFRSATTLCVPDPIFEDERHHSLLVPTDMPVQRLLLSAFSTQGLTGGGGIQFEVWCRYYYPNVRDQMVARGTLSLSRLCAMVTMQRRDEVGIQTFSLPLIPRTEDSGEPRSSGLLDVSVKYRCSLKAATGVLAAQAVSISVQIRRAAGLQAAARALAEKNPSLQYSADVGVNAYVTVRLPFLPEGERRSTRTVGRTFCPEFDHHAEFPCNLVVQRSSGESCCLGELLQYSEAVFSIFHQNLNSAPGTSQTQASRDYLLGTVKVPTRELLFRRSGIRGWYPLTLPEDLTPPHSASVVQAVAGGLDLTVTFAHPGDRERVLDAAALLGWNREGALGGSPQDDSDSESALPSNPALLTISIPRLWLPVQCLLLAGQARVNKSTYCYLRYKLYDREAAWTSLRRPRLAEDQKHATVAFKSKRVELPRSQGLWWYFREERLEFQVWRAYGNERHTERPLDTDRLIGSAYVDLTALGEDSGTKRTVSGVYPLFRRNASNLLGAAVRIHIALASAAPCSLEPAEHGGSSSSEYEEGRKGPSIGQQGLESLSHRLDPSAVGASTEKSPEESPPAVDPQETFAVSILVERAMHLSLKGSPLTERGVTAPSSYVSFATADPASPNATEIVEETDSPVWDFQRQTRLSKELLLDSQQTLVFKVWHKADAERVIGFASVDLSPLLSGFQLVCGWYNIVDFSGQCQGQLKVAVSPLESIIHLKEERLARTRTKAPGSTIRATSPFAFQARDLCAGLPTFSTRDHEELFNPSSKGTEAADHERTGSSVFSTPRHEEHVKNIRRFHESLQQAEGNAHRAGRLDSLSQSSRTSLLRALRKNLSELDEIKRYFSQKLTRPFPDPGTPERNAGGLSSRYSSPASKTADPERQLLLEKSSHLVSQVSNLINGAGPDNTSKESAQSQVYHVTWECTGLQNNRAKNGPEPSDACEEFSSRFSALLDQRGGATRTPEGPRDIPRKEVSSSRLDEKPSSLPEKASCGQGMLYEFLGRAGSQSDPPFDTHSGPKAEEAAESQSEEDYEEDVIEPRTLNELTTVTDKTSPWSSLVSEGEPDPDREAVNITEAGWPDGCSEPLLGGEQGRSGSLSVVTQEESLSTPSTARSSTGPSGEERGGECGGRRNLAGSPEDMLWSTPALEADRLNRGGAEKEESGRKGALETQAEGAGSEPAALWSGGDSAAGYAVAPEIEPEALGFDPQDVGGADTPEEEHRCSPGLSEPAQHRSSSSDEGDQDQPEDSGELLQPKAALSNPVVVPNFFLPPQHLEASMRLLSLSAPPPTTATESQGSETAQPSLRSEQPILQVSRPQVGSIAALRGVPRRQRNHPKPSLAPADLPEEETQRIARIFSTQFSKQ